VELKPEQPVVDDGTGQLFAHLRVESGRARRPEVAVLYATLQSFVVVTTSLWKGADVEAIGPSTLACPSGLERRPAQ
jgi:hypothetical protein